MDSFIHSFTQQQQQPSTPLTQTFIHSFIHGAIFID